MAENKYESFPWVVEAANGVTELPTGMDLNDILCYKSLFYLYKNFNDGKTDVTAATKAKELIIKEWRDSKIKEDERVVMFNRFGSLYNEVSVKMADYNKNPCAETAIAFTEKCKEVLFKTAQ